MAIENLFDHKCDIYHMAPVTSNLGYGIESQRHEYPDVADIADIPCHFNVDVDGIMTQTESANEYIFTGKLQLPAGTDIRLNDKIVDVNTGVSYTAQIPKNIRDHHIVVTIQRKGTVKGAL